MVDQICSFFSRCIRRWVFIFHWNTNEKPGLLIRYVAASSLAKKMGSIVSIFQGYYIEHIGNLSIGNYVSIHQMCYLDADGGS